MRAFSVFMVVLFPALALAATPLATETIAKGEATDTQTVVDTLTKQVEAQAKLNGTAKRDAHGKAHGCVWGTFKIEDSLADASLRLGVFTEGAEYKAWTRFSNGSKEKDFEGDARGLAIKLMGITGDKLEIDEKFTQDFLFINHNRFIVRSPADYVEFTNAVAKGDPLPFFFPSLFPTKWRLSELSIARAIQGKKVTNPLAIEYFSTTPYLLGEGQAVKYSVRPWCATPKVAVDPKSDDFLQDGMKQHLDQQEACFEFLVQRQTHGDKMPIEDSTVEWKTNRSAFIKVATLRVPAQSFNSELQKSFCENLSFSPWHSLEVHRPLGNINRMRRAIYNTISELRHRLNNEPRLEPTGDERFGDKI